MTRNRPQAPMQPAGLTADVLHEIRKAMRALRRAEKRITTDHRAQRRRAERLAEQRRTAP